MTGPSETSTDLGGAVGDPVPPTRLRTVSLQWRSILAVLLVLVVVLAGLAVVVDRTFAAQATRNANTLLAGRVQLARQLARAGNRPERLITRIDVRGVRASLQTTDGRTFGTLPPAGQRKLITRVTLSGTGRIDGATLTLAVDTSFIDNAQRALRRSLVITGIGALVLGALLITVVLRLALRPLDAFGALARQVIAGRRGGRLAPSRTDTELGQAAAAVDGMLDTLEGAEQHARDAEAEARRAAQRSQEFLSDAAHELRTPIAGVQAAAESLLHQGSGLGEAEREQLLVLLVREAQRSGRLAADLLTAARLDTGVDVQHEAFDVADLLRGEADRTALLHPGLSIAVHGLQTLGEPVIVSDPAKIRSVIGNLLGNAVRAVGGAGSIDLAVTATGAELEIMVTDSGRGIPADQRERVFERLVRLDAARSRTEGTDTGGSGLGLAIARGYARALGGDLVCVEPPAGVTGAAFLLTLPR